MPAKSFASSCIHFDVISKHCFTTLAKTININNTDQIIQTIMRPNLKRFPLLPLRHFAVTQKHPGPIREFIQIFCIQGHTKPHRKSLPKRAGCNLSKRKCTCWMSFKATTKCPKCEKFFSLYPTCSSPHSIQEGRGMPLGKN